MIHRLAVLLLSASGLTLAAPPPEAPPPNLFQVYRANTDPSLPPLPPGVVYSLGAVAFSPDENWISVSIYQRTARSGAPPLLHTTLLLLPLHPDGDRKVVKTEPAGLGTVLWSPDSQSVVVQPRGHGATQIYNLSGQQIGTGPPSGYLVGFLAPSLLLARHAKANGRLAGFDTIAIQTSAVTPWRAPKNAQFAALDSERGLLALFTDLEGSKTLIVDAASGKVVQSMKNQNQTIVAASLCDEEGAAICLNDYMPPRSYFAENGKTLCEASIVGSFKNHPICRDIDTGKTIAEFPGVDGGAPASASTRGSRMVLSNLSYLPGAEGGGSYRGRVVWDFRAGTEVAAWGPSTRQTAWVGASGASVRSAPTATISPSGNYVAEVLGDELHLYQIP